MHIEYLIIILIGIIIQQLILLYYIIKLLELKYKRKIIYLTFIFFVTIPVSVLFIYSVYHPFNARGIIVAAMFVLYSFLVSKNKAKDIIVMFIIYLMLILISDALGSATIYLVIGSFSLTEKYIALGTFFHSVYFVPLSFLFMKYYKKEKLMQKFTQIRIFLPFIITQMIFIVTLFFLVMDNNKNVLIYYIIALILVFVCMDILFYINSKQMVKKEMLEYKYEQLETQRNIEYEYIMEQVEQSNKYKKFNHDMRNNLVVLRELLENNKDAVGLDMLNDIVNEALLLEERQFSANPAINALFNFKQKYASDNDIKLTSDLSLPVKLPMKDIELCSIFSNLLDNALEACTNILNTEKWIHCHAGIDKNTLVVKVENSIDISSEIKKKKIKKFVDDTGLGLSIIDDIVKRYDGDMKIEQDSTVYRIFVFISI